MRSKSDVVCGYSYNGVTFQVYLFSICLNGAKLKEKSFNEMKSKL